MRIGLDVDDVILDTSTEIIREVSKRLNIEADKEMCTSFSIETTYGVKPKVAKDIVRSVLWRDYIPPKSNAINCINLLWLTQKCSIYLISNKHKEIYDHDIKLLKELGLYIPFAFYLVGKAKNGTPAKAKVINKKGIELFVEDRSDTILDILANTNCKIVVMDAPWNRDIEEGGRVLRVKNWLELFPLIMKFILIGDFSK
uniref:Uncharacterized protein n=1 Tax=viral metagenome TaxID=1070528 RepID=A0A6H1ZWI7_9ZZZZ